MDKKKDVIHILARYSDRLYKIENTVEAHQKVLYEKGAAWFGKIGKPLSQSWIERMNDQVKNGVPTFVYLVQNKFNHYDVTRGPVICLTRALPMGEEDLIPQYYIENGFLKEITLWAKLSAFEALDGKYLSRLRAVSSVTQIPETLKNSMTGMFVVYEKASVL